MLSYAVSVFDETDGVSDELRKKIADGEMSFTIDEPASVVNPNTTLRTSISIAYYHDAPAEDAGAVDTMTSKVVFGTSSLYATEMEKTVLLSDRKGMDNLSYTVTANYASEPRATYQALDGKGNPKGEQKEMALPNSARRDNEMMLMLARAQALSPESSTVFKMINVFDTFLTGELTEYTMVAQTSSELVTLYPGEWVSSCGIEGVEDADGKTVYPVTCYNTIIGINSDRSGPPYTVQYTQDPLIVGGKAHAKIPFKITYRQYKNGKGYRCTEYMLTGCSFTK